MRQELFASRRHAASLLLLPVLVFSVCLMVLVDLGPRSPDPAMNDAADEALRALGLAGLGVCGLLFVALLPALWRRAPALVIDDEGFDDRGGALSAGRVRWEHVASVRVVSLARDYVGIDLVDVDAFLEGAPPLRRLAVRFDLLLGYPAITIPGRSLGVDTHELARTITAARDAARSRGAS